MDAISELPDALLLRILSLLPTKDVVATMVLSKRWQPLWMMVPRLVYDDSYQNIEYGRFSAFVYRSLLLHEAPVLETVHFKLGQKSASVDIGVWTRTLVKRSVRELIIEIIGSSCYTTPTILPRCLFMGCRMLVTLELREAVLVDVTCPFSFPSLKKLSLISMKYPGSEFVNRLLSNCPVLEDLGLEQCEDDNVINLTIKVPSLKRLVLYILTEDGLVIDAPSLEYLDLHNCSNEFSLIENEMPNLVEADVVLYNHPGNILSSITSVKHLYLCLRSAKDVYPVGSVFHRLIHLEICTCETEWLNLLMCLLRDSPKLQSLKLEKCHDPEIAELAPCWIKPSSVPECVLSSLETFKWVKYKGTKEEKEVAAFILRSGSCLENVTIFSKSTDRDEKLEMVKELTMLPRCSPTCQLEFE